MKGTYHTVIGTVLCIITVLILLHLFLRDSSSIDALPSVKSLLPVYPYTRRSTIKHVQFDPVTFVQISSPGFNFRNKIQEMIREKNDMYDTQMISMIRNYFIHQPSSQEYKLDKKDQFDYSGGQSAEVDNILRFKEDGFYVECCNTDGEKTSSSLFFERVRKWNGLVIVSDPDVFSNLKEKNRKAMTMNSCISQSEYSMKKMVTSGSAKDSQTEIYCFPLYSIMAALERRNIDFFALDVGGDEELSILKAIPFSELDINIMTVRFKGEIRHYKSEVQLFLEDLGFDTVLKLVKEDDSVHHLILKKREPALFYLLLRILLFMLLILIFGCIVYLYVSKYYQKHQTMTLSF